MCLSVFLPQIAGIDLTMRIGVMGAGGVGGFLGGKIALSGKNVVFIARGTHLDALRKGGLSITGPEAFTLPEVSASADTKAVGPVDIIMFCVKLYDTKKAADQLKPMLGPDTVILTFQNGVESAKEIQEVVGNYEVVSGAAYFPANISSPGEINFKGVIGGKCLVEIGDSNETHSNTGQRLIDLLTKSNISALLRQDPDVMLWEKFCWIAGVSGVTAATRQTIGVTRTDADMRGLFASCVHECAEVGRAMGVDLSFNLEQQLMTLLDTNPPAGKSSLLVDLERGRRLELDGLAGAIHRFGLEHHVPTPVTSTIFISLKSFRDGDPSG